MLTVVRSEPDDVEAALARLGLTEAPLKSAVFVGYGERAACTANDAPNAPGFLQWNKTLRTAREQLSLQGWQACNDDRYSTVVSPCGRIAIAVASGCANTGLPNGRPTNRSKKGPSTASAVSNNAQLSLPFEPPVPREVVEDPERATWLLLFHNDKHELRAELSLPVSMDDDGYIDHWRERIILAAQPLDPAPEVPVPDFTPDIDIDIRRRA
jgi:hypothetical protein